MKHQKNTTKKDYLLQTVWQTHVDKKPTRPLLIFFLLALAIFAVHPHCFHLPPLPIIFSVVTAAIPAITECTYAQFKFHRRSILPKKLNEDKLSQRIVSEKRMLFTLIYTKLNMNFVPVCICLVEEQQSQDRALRVL